MKKGNLGILAAVIALMAIMAVAMLELIRYMAAVREVSMPVTGKMYDEL